MLRPEESGSSEARSAATAEAEESSRPRGTLVEDFGIPGERPPCGEEIRTWLETNTFHHSEFSDYAALARDKETAGLRISLCLPTLNEEDTIGREIEVLKGELMDRVPLLDEIAVIDSGSTDRTVAIARERGADVYLSSEILPGRGARLGKGENLWKALHQLRGDILCYVDADIRNIHPKFVAGLVAPLLLRPEVSYVKAFYERPLGESDDLQMLGGGRVTEILVRPLFSTFFPSLTAFVQPLSGEYAVRRELLETLSFPVGYGVEMAHLVDVWHEHGLGAFAQVDLDERFHGHKSTAELGKMSFGLLQIFLDRLRRHDLLPESLETEAVYRPLVSAVGTPEFESLEILEEERPPMITLPEYRERHGR